MVDETFYFTVKIKVSFILFFKLADHHIKEKKTVFGTTQRIFSKTVFIEEHNIQ